MARMTAVAMLLPGLLVAVLPTIAVIVSIMLRAREAWPFTTAKDVSGAMLRIPVMAGVSCMVLALCHAVLPIAATAGVSSLTLHHAFVASPSPCCLHMLSTLDVPRDNQLVNHPLTLPSASLFANAACRPPTPAHTIASSLQHARTLNVPLHFLHSLFSSSASRISFPLLHNLMKHAYHGMQGVSVSVGAALASMAGTREWKESVEMRMRALGVQLEETRRELAATKGELEKAERRRAVEAREMKGQLEERKSGSEETERTGVLEMREMRGWVEERERDMSAELAAVKVELATAKLELGEHKQSTALQLEEAERRRVAEISEMRRQVEERADKIAVELGVVQGELGEHKQTTSEH
ncbi:unnamed protein product [Closterium sp. NIES-65]|nr:unnamed protein product [Closterium sp. NIES-65]